MPRLLRTALVTLLAASAASARDPWQGQCVASDATTVSYCTVNVFDFETGQLAAVYSDPELSNTLANPLMADVDGRFGFFAPQGVYEVRMSGGALGAGRRTFAWIGFEQGETAVPAGAAVIDIRTYGATANDASDDLAAIQATIDAAAAVKGIVWIPAGVFQVAPSGNCFPCLRVPSGVRLVGAGEDSILRVRANSGPFDTLFANAATTTEDVLFSNFTIDQNIEQNPGTVSAQAGRHGYLLRFYAGRRVRIEKMRLLHAGINAVTLNGPAVSDIELVANYAEYHADPQSPPYDNTALYADGYRITAVNNTVVGKIVPGMPVINGAAIGAIELHGGPGVAAGNLVRDVRVCMSLVSAWSGAPDPRVASLIAAIGNRCEGVNEGIRLAAMNGRTLRRVAVAGNEIEIAQTRWNQHLSMGIELEWSADLTGDFNDIVIEGNVIAFEQEGEGSERATALLTNVGIGLAPAGNVRQVEVTGNRVIGAPLMAMRVGNLLHPSATYRETLIAGNEFTEYGQNRLANPYFRLGIRTEGHVSDITIERNRFTITALSDPRPAVVMVAQSAATATSYNGCVVRENEGAEFSVVDPSCSVTSRSTRGGRAFRAR